MDKIPSFRRFDEGEGRKTRISSSVVDFVSQWIIYGRVIHRFREWIRSFFFPLSTV